MGNFGSDVRPKATARKRADAVQRVREASGLPPEFFAIDFSDLPAMVATWRQLDEGDAAEALQAVEDADRADHERATEQQRSHGKP